MEKFFFSDEAPKQNSSCSHFKSESLIRVEASMSFSVGSTHTPHPFFFSLVQVMTLEDEDKQK